MYVWYREQRILFIAHPRTGHTSVLDGFSRAGIQYSKQCRIIHAEIGDPLRLSRFTFSVVRHPWHRFRSIWRYAFSPERRAELPHIRPMSLDALVDYVGHRLEADAKLNKHLVPQHRGLAPDGRLLTRNVFAFDDMPAAWRRIAAGVERACGVRLDAMPHRRPSIPAETDADEAVLRKRVEELYAEDVRLWRRARADSALHRL